MKRTERNFSGVSVGGVTIVMIFSVLCLTIFAVLSLITARNELSLAQKSADAVTNYYAADSRAIEIMDAIAASYDGINFNTPEDIDLIYYVDGGEDFLSYSVPVDDRQNLRVLLKDDNGEVSVILWQVEENGAWTADEFMHVWDGDPIF